MIEKTIIDFLAGKMSPVPVYMERPEKLPDGKYIVIERTSGSRSNFVRTAQITIQSYADTLAKACELNAEVENAMFDLVTVDSVSRCELNSSYNYTNPTTRQYRYQAVFDVTYMEV